MTSSWKNKVIRNFDRYAPQYDFNANTQKNIAISFVNDLPKNANTVLEIGCGTGLLTTLLEQNYRGKNLHITDISSAMLEQTRYKLGHTMVSASNQSLPESY